MLLAEFSFCERYGQKRVVENCEDGCHYTGYLCHEIKNCASNRLPTSIKQYAQGLAWLLEDSEIDIEHVKSVVPYSLAHRIQWKDEVLSQKERAKRDDPFPIFLAKEAVKTVSQRYREQSEHLKDALAVGSKIFQGESLEPWKETIPFMRKSRRIIEYPTGPIRKTFVFPFSSERRARRMKASIASKKESPILPQTKRRCE